MAPPCAARAFYAEFDDVKGPVVMYEEPPGCLTSDEEGRRIWECFGDYVITSREDLDGVAVRARAGREREHRPRPRPRSRSPAWVLGLYPPSALVCRSRCQRVGAG